MINAEQLGKLKDAIQIWKNAIADNMGVELAKVRVSNLLLTYADGLVEAADFSVTAEAELNAIKEENEALQAALDASDAKNDRLNEEVNKYTEDWSVTTTAQAELKNDSVTTAARSKGK